MTPKSDDSITVNRAANRHRLPGLAFVLSLILSLALALMAGLNRLPLAPNAGFLNVPQLSDELWEGDLAALEQLVAERFVADQARMDLSTELRINQWMELAWKADMATDCAEYQAKATRLANEFPTLLSPWRVLWECWDGDDLEGEQIRRWIVALMNHAVNGPAAAVHYSERGLRVHNLSDALSYVSLSGNTVIDAWFETLAQGQLLRVGVLLWDSEEEHDTRWYFDPLTTQRVYADSWAEDTYCRVRLAACMVQHSALSSYSVPEVIANALLLQAEGQTEAAITELRGQAEVSAQASLLLFDWLSLNFAALKEGESIELYARHASNNDSAEGKLLLSLIKDDAAEEAAARQSSASATQGNSIRGDNAQGDNAGGDNTEESVNQTDKAVADASADELWQAARAELSQDDFAYYWAKYRHRLNRVRSLANTSPSNTSPEPRQESQEYSSAIARPWYQAIEAGSSAAMYQVLSARLDNPTALTEAERQETLSWLITAANSRHREAMYRLGELFTQQTPNVAQGLGATQRSAISPDTSLWVEYDLNKAALWLRRAGELGHGPALAKLSGILLESESITSAQQQTAIWAAQLGAQWRQPDSLRQLVELSQRGVLGTPAQETAQWLIWAAEQGDGAAQLALGLRYWHGDGIVQNGELAERWLHKAEQQGHNDARYQLAQFYAQEGQSVQRKRSAVLLLQNAAEQGHAPSQHLLGRWFEEYGLLSKNLSLATQWFARAANQAYRPALSDYARSLEQADGVNADTHALANGTAAALSQTQAYSLWQRAAAQGDQRAFSMMAIYQMMGRLGEAQPQQALRLFYQGVRGDPQLERLIRLLERHPGGILASSAALLNWAEQEYQRLSQIPAEETLGQSQTRQAAQERLIVWAERYLANWRQAPQLAAERERWMERGADAGLAEYSWRRAERRNSGDAWLDPANCTDYQHAWQGGVREAFVFKALCLRALDQALEVSTISTGTKSVRADDLPILMVLEVFRQAQQLSIPGADIGLAQTLIRASQQDESGALAVEGYQRLKALAAQGHPKAIFLLGIYLERRQPQKLAEMLRYYRQSAEMGNVVAQNNLGRLLMSTETAFADPKNGWQWAYLAHIQGSAAATDTLGEAHEHGWVGAPDWRLAVDYYLQAGRAGQGLSYVNAARLLATGGYNLAANLAQANECVMKAWQLGYLVEPWVMFGDVRIDLDVSEQERSSR